MSLYRCQNQECSTDPHGRLIFDFEAPQPVCPKCGADARLPEFTQIVINLETVHFLVKDKAGPVIGLGARYRAACRGQLAGSFRATGSAADVNCPGCRASAEWQQCAPGGGSGYVATDHGMVPCS